MRKAVVPLKHHSLSPLLTIITEMFPILYMIDGC
jgi:hypothetical protein